MTDSASVTQDERDETSPGVTKVPRSATVRQAQVNPKVLFWSVAVAAGVIVLSFVSIILHGLILKGL